VLSGNLLATEYVHGSADPETRRRLRKEVLDVIDLLRQGEKAEGRSCRHRSHPKMLGEDIESPSPTALQEISTELPVESLWPSVELDGLDVWG
jgi:hypothetical protein